MPCGCAGDTAGLEKQKKKRLKIKRGGASGTRLVFDEEGQALPPLAQLALAKGGAAECARAHRFMHHASLPAFSFLCAASAGGNRGPAGACV